MNFNVVLNIAMEQNQPQLSGMSSLSRGVMSVARMSQRSTLAPLGAPCLYKEPYAKPLI
jgi:hypothetical protein